MIEQGRIAGFSCHHERRTQFFRLFHDGFRVFNGKNLNGSGQAAF